MLISFILPVFNVEKYLKECIDSLIKADIKNSEIILVIGKSTDKSNEICYEYEEKYENIKVIVRNSTGLSNGRNCGFNVCKGKYVAFIDSDDYVNSENLVKTINLLEKNSEIDVLVTDYIKDYGENSKKSTNQIKSKSTFHDYTYTKQFLKSKGFYFSVWRNIYKKEFLEKENFTFMEGYICEDVPYTTKIFAKTEKIYYSSLEYYNYRINRDGSLMNTFSIKRILDSIEVFYIGIENLENSTLVGKEYFIDKILLSYFYTMPEIYAGGKFNDECYKAFSDSIFILKKSRKFKIIYMIIKVFGIKCVAKLLNTAKKIKNAI